jgi:hypothetical protein
MRTNVMRTNDCEHFDMWTAFPAWGLFYKHFGLVMYAFHSKLVRLSQPMKATDNNKKQAYRPFSVYYKSIMFYDTGPWSNICEKARSLPYHMLPSWVGLNLTREK